MFEEFKEKFIELITSRSFVLMIVLSIAFASLVYRVFDLQIVHGEEYMDSFETRIKKEITIDGTRGNIYDRNGNLLAYNELAHAVKIEDVYESGRYKNLNLNTTIYETIKIIEGNKDKVVSDFKIALDKNGEYYYTVEGTSLSRFLADVYGHSSINDLTVKEKTSTPEDVINYLCGWERFRIGFYNDNTKKDGFIPGNGYSRSDLLKILNVRYDMNNNSYQKYISTTIASDVSEETVAVIMENYNELQGVSIEEGTIRKYVDPVYMSNILGYTGKVSSTEELNNLLETNMSYTINDTVGKLGVEKSMENYLQGKKGSETIFVNSVGKTTEVANYIEPIAGNDIYLTIDKDLQVAVYKMLEEHLASILYTKIINAKEFDASAVSASKIMIPIYDVYIALINNNVIDIDHLSDEEAKDNEKAVYAKYISKREAVFEKLRNELYEKRTVYTDLNKEYKVYESYIIDKLYQEGILNKDAIDPEDKTYIAWTTDETISAYEFINYCISMNWIDVSKLDIDTQYSDSEKIYNYMVNYILDELYKDKGFIKKIFTYMIKNDEISGSAICKILIEQDIVELDESEENKMLSGVTTAYAFMMARIKNLDITPAMLALDPCSASCVITDVRTGDVLALVSYPGFDNNMLANGVDPEYYAALQEDYSTPMINYATRHKTAPGSTFKPVSATAGLMEGVISTATRFTCTGLFDKVAPPAACWIYGQGAHGSLNVSEAIRHSCNMFFYELGYQLGSSPNGYSSDYALSRLQVYADAYGLTDLSGVEIEESMPSFSKTDGVRSAIGQGSHSYTTVGLARYVTAVANSGTCYNLTLLDKVTDRSGNLLKDNSATVRNEINMDPSYWRAIHQGMREVVESRSDYADMKIKVAGKTGTAEESRNRANHALFICYAPYDDPQIAIATRIAYGYSSTYAAQTTKDILNYYFKIEDEEELITGQAQVLDNVTTVTD
ncbi:MAG: penicillin-binding protein [Lachnospiraceae bacterium]|nr:penicillin-binding protein [Lachnospiraceae bacterium]